MAIPTPDSIVDNRHTCWRVQVKSTDKLGRNGLYQVHSGHAVYGNKIQPYHEPDIDFLAFYLFRVDTWYIIPRSAIGTRLSVTLYAPYRRHKGIYSQYFEAWRLLKQPRPCTCNFHVGTIHACADPAYDTSGIWVPRSRREAKGRPRTRYPRDGPTQAFFWLEWGC